MSKAQLDKGLTIQHDCGCVICEKHQRHAKAVIDAVVLWHRTRRHVIEHPTWDTTEHAVRDVAEMDNAREVLSRVAGLLSMETEP